MSYESYPYTGRAGACKYNAKEGIVKTSGYVKLPKYDA